MLGAGLLNVLAQTPEFRSEIHQVRADAGCFALPQKGLLKKLDRPIVSLSCMRLTSLSPASYLETRATRVQVNPVRI
jgi:hypothetical protein